MAVYGVAVVVCFVLTLCALPIAEASLLISMLSKPIVAVKFLTVEWYNLLHDVLSPTIFSLGSLIGVVLITVGVVAVAYFIYQTLCRPLNRVKNLGDIGYIVEQNESKKGISNFIQRMRKVGDLPPVFPNGWFGLIESHRLPRGESKPVNFLGLNLAIFRDEFDEVHCLDAYCPHMGANLGAGGRVEKNCLVCPFHGWQFRGTDGKCVKIPYLQNEKIPEVAKVKSYIVHELNGWIYLWYDAEEREPFWDVPELERITKGDWTYRGRTEHIISSHIEEIPENGADVAHLSQVHGASILGGSDLRYMFTKWLSLGGHSWTAEWRAMPEPDGHIGELKLTHKFDFLGYTIPLADLNVYARQVGPGIVYLEFTSIFGTGVFIQSLTPLEPMRQKLVHNIYSTRWMPTFIAKLFMLGEALQVERDLMIWNNKKYAGRPVLVKAKEDSLISRHRRWYSQFYSENSPRLTMIEKDSFDW